MAEPSSGATQPDDNVFDGSPQSAPQQDSNPRAKLGKIGKASSIFTEQQAASQQAAPSRAHLMQRGRSIDAGSALAEDNEAPMLFQKRKEFIRLRNLLTGQDTVDTLHQSGIMVSKLACRCCLWYCGRFERRIRQ